MQKTKSRAGGDTDIASWIGKRMPRCHRGARPEQAPSLNTSENGAGTASLSDRSDSGNALALLKSRRSGFGDDGTLSTTQTSEEMRPRPLMAHIGRSSQCSRHGVEDRLSVRILCESAPSERRGSFPIDDRIVGLPSSCGSDPNSRRRGRRAVAG